MQYFLQFFYQNFFAAVYYAAATIRYHIYTAAVFIILYIIFTYSQTRLILKLLKRKQCSFRIIYYLNCNKHYQFFLRDRQWVQLILWKNHFFILMWISFKFTPWSKNNLCNTYYHSSLWCLYFSTASQLVVFYKFSDRI